MLNSRRIIQILLPVVIAAFGIDSFVDLTGLIETQKKWRSSFDSIDDRNHFLTQLTTNLGYGGLIHNFKNYLIRGDENDHQNAKANIEYLKHFIDKYREDTLLSENERSNLAVIEETVASYSEQLYFIKSLRNDISSIEQIDTLVDIDDTRSLQAIKNLERHLKNHYENEMEQFSKTSREEIVENVILDLVIVAVLTLMFIAITNNMKSTEKKLIDAKVTAENAEKSKSLFLANMSHEIRTPLFGVSGALELLDEDNLTEDHKETVDIIKSSTRRLSAIVNDILDLSKLQAGKFTLSNRVFTVRNHLENICSALKISADQKDIQLKIDIERTCACAVESDPDRLGQVLTNLIGNAIKFTEKGHVNVSVRCDVAMYEVNATYTIEDTGIGLPENEIERLFEQFAQEDSSRTRRFQGTGLGLSISKQLVELMGGTISAKRNQYGGATFAFTVPLKMFINSEAAIDTASEKIEPLEGMPHILVADDNPVNQKIVQRFIAKLGGTCELADNGQEAVDKLKGGNFDLVLMDMQMPVMDGIEATRLIRNLPDPNKRKVPVVALTANVLIEDRNACLEIGMNHFLTKPMTIEKLRDCLERIRLS